MSLYSEHETNKFKKKSQSELYLLHTLSTVDTQSSTELYSSYCNFNRTYFRCELRIK